MICECSHLTTFLSLFNKGAEVIQESNYDVWDDLVQISGASLKTNIGFYIACSYWVLFLVFGVAVISVDRKKLRRKKFLVLYEETHLASFVESHPDSSLEDTSANPIEIFDGKK